MDRTTRVPVADELEIRNLVARYCHAVSEGDDAAWTATWSADAEWSVLGSTVRGRGEILAHYRRIVSGVRWVIQLATNGVIEADGDAARGRWLVVETAQTRDGRPLLNLGQYLDRYRRDAEGAWRFARREFRNGYLGPPVLVAEPRALGGGPEAR
jgi:ketosteroid isomerase-like protein